MFLFPEKPFEPPAETNNEFCNYTVIVCGWLSVCVCVCLFTQYMCDLVWECVFSVSLSPMQDSKAGHTRSVHNCCTIHTVEPCTVPLQLLISFWFKARVSIGWILFYLNKWHCVRLLKCCHVFTCVILSVNPLVFYWMYLWNNHIFFLKLMCMYEYMYPDYLIPLHVFHYFPSLVQKYNKKWLEQCKTPLLRPDMNTVMCSYNLLIISWTLSPSNGPHWTLFWKRWTEILKSCSNCVMNHTYCLFNWQSQLKRQFFRSIKLLFVVKMLKYNKVLC